MFPRSSIVCRTELETSIVVQPRAVNNAPRSLLDLMSNLTDMPSISILPRNRFSSIILSGMYQPPSLIERHTITGSSCGTSPFCRTGKTEAVRILANSLTVNPRPLLDKKSANMRSSFSNLCNADFLFPLDSEQNSCTTSSRLACFIPKTLVNRFSQSW